MGVYVKEPKSVFFHVAKTGGVSISNWMFNNIPNAIAFDKSEKHAEPNQFFKTVRIFKKDGFRFCVVRNPWDRLHSMYEYLKRRNKLLPNHDSFETFILSGHWGKCTQPQFNYSQYCDYVVQYENMEEDFKEIQKFYNCYEPLIKANVNPNPAHYSEFYTQNMIDVVRHKHHIDIETYRYNYERTI